MTDGIVHGTMVGLDRDDVDTDTIMPQQFLSGVSATGFGESVFHHWRRTGQIPLDDPQRAGAAILVAGDNFGVGSSREHAVWGLKQWGFDAVVAVGFGDIFKSNCIKNGLAPVALDPASCAALRTLALTDPTATAQIDIATGEVTASGFRATFELDPITRRMLIEDLDEIALTLSLEQSIAELESARPAWLPTTWAELPSRRTPLALSTRAQRPLEKEL